MVRNIDYFDSVPGTKDVKLVGQPRWTLPWEVQWLIAKARTVPGNICEIGVLDGATTLELATAFPDRTVHAVDVKTMWEGYQKLCGGPVCHRAKHLPNVKLHLCNSENYFYEDETFVFIDGEHSWFGVHVDTSRVFGWFRPSGNFADARGGRKGCVVWHDYQPSVSWHDNVFDYLNARSLDWPILHPNGTMLAYIDFP